MQGEEAISDATNPWRDRLTWFWFPPLLIMGVGCLANATRRDSCAVISDVPELLRLLQLGSP